MSPIAADQPHEDALRFIRGWFALLAAGSWAEATAALDEPNSYGITWTPELIRRVVEEDTFGPESRFRRSHPEGIVYTDPREVPSHPHVEIYEFDDASGFAVEFPVPLNGVWSDLTAEFEFLRRSTGYAAVLHDLHVL